MNWTSYLIQANLYLVFFYAFYWFILRKETFFNLNRTYLLASALSAALIPLIKIGWLSELFMANPAQQNFVRATVVIMGGYATPIEESWSLGDYLFLLYVAVILIMCGRLVFKLIKVKSLLNQKNQSDAFSFFKKIRVDENLPYKESIEKHELAHAKQLHSADVLLFEVLAIINWFNPIVYLYKKSIKHIHEFIADEAVLQTEIDKKQYALLLLSERFGVSPNSLTNNFFNQSLLKQRIQMMNKTKSRKTAILKYGLSAPLFLLAMVLSSAKISESKTINQLSEKIKPTQEINGIVMPKVVSDLVESKPNKTKLNEIKAQPKLELIKVDSVVKPVPNKTNYALNEIVVIGYSSNDTTKNREIFTNVEVLPSFPGGLQAFGKFLAQNLKYPEVAKKANIQGRVFCQFIVEKDGSLSNIRVVSGIGGGCDEEAVRVLAISPKWKPGLQNDKVVRVSYTIPIFFQINSESTNNNLAPPSPPIDFSSKTRPLIIIDGIECKDEETFKTIRPNSIDHVDVLKDEAAIAKYGPRGKNGVIVFTTKKK